MTDIEQKAQSLFSKVLIERGALNRNIDRDVSAHEALCRALEQHEAFKQEVSDAVEAYDNCDSEWESETLWPVLAGFIIPKPKPDPLREIAEAWGLHNTVAKSWVEDLRATLEARGFEIREKNDD